MVELCANICLSSYGMGRYGKTTYQSTMVGIEIIDGVLAISYCRFMMIISNATEI